MRDNGVYLDTGKGLLCALADFGEFLKSALLLRR
jgi:hypothetical protein